ncbi:MAG TPA: tRNA lysidine(34) synthetase TilS [Sideroxyarcus sp.]|nr:tRNA lysidine(34) synthetase TilS [Sideroxyarcus sp.]
MASSRKSNLADTVAARLAPLLPKHSHILIGLSGGMDSSVLLHLLNQLTPRFQWRLSALHVHHGISRNADTWADFCGRLCAGYGIPLHVERVDIGPLRDEHGIEAAARKLRHAAFAKQSCDAVALAHHADDQAETLLLQLLRGAGIKGAAAMPAFKPAAAGIPATLRPLLDVPRKELLEFAQQHSLQWVEDESNADERYPRNFLRHRMLPLLEQQFPACRDTLARSARHFAEAGDLLDELAQQDAPGLSGGGGLEVRLLRGLSHSRAKNLLRYFLHVRSVPMPHEAQLDEMLRQLLDAREDAAICVETGLWQVRRYQGKVYAVRALCEFDPALVLRWNGEAELEWPATGMLLSFGRTIGQGVSLDRLMRAPVTLRLRNGGESLCPRPGATPRSLKNLLQEYQVPPWQRERLPLLYSGDTLVAVVGVSIAAEFQAADHEAGLVVA